TDVAAQEGIAQEAQRGGWRMITYDNNNSFPMDPPRPEGPSRILIAEDDEPTRRLLADWLEEERYHIQLAADGMQALDTAGSFVPDLIGLDVKLPALDGLEVARRLQARSRGSGGLPIPILMLSGLGEDVDRVAGLSAGADDYVTKPVRPRELLL